MANSSSTPSIDPYEFLQVIPNSDGSLTRLKQLRTLPTNPTDSGSGLLSLSKDIPINATTNTFLRLFRPRLLPPAAKLPLIIYFHGGGFVFMSAATPCFHNSCSAIAAKTPAFVLSVEYRLAPEHRLPAAYDDAVDALNWVRDQSLGVNDQEPWLKDTADYSTCLLMGGSAGGNIAYFACLRALDLDLSPVKIQGLILNQPAFGGAKRTESELRIANDRLLPFPTVVDTLWALSLPEGADRDHEYCNPMTAGSRDEMIGRLPKCLFRGYCGDPMVDRYRELVKMLKSRGVHVVEKFREDGGHNVEIFVPLHAEVLCDDVQEFVHDIHSPKSRM